MIYHLIRRGHLGSEGSVSKEKYDPRLPFAILSVIDLMVRQIAVRTLFLLHRKEKK